MGLYARVQVCLRAYLSACMYRIVCLSWAGSVPPGSLLGMAFYRYLFYIIFRPIGHNLCEVGFRLPPPTTNHLSPLHYTGPPLPLWS